VGRIGNSYIVSVAVTTAISFGGVPAAAAPTDDLWIDALLKLRNQIGVSLSYSVAGAMAGGRHGAEPL
jgi:hypothetical protein